jgi:prepilin-type N-terminal cleavage/methylation domain-containing protein
MKEKGFTLIELLIVLALIAILASILILVINPGEIMTRGRDAKRQGDLRHLVSATDAYISDMGIGANLPWIVRGNCSSTSPGNIFFSLVPADTSTPPTGWPAVPSGTATGTTSQIANGNGWVPLNFQGSTLVSLSSLPLDPRNNVTSNGVTFAYSFTCDTSFNYEYGAKLERDLSTMANDGGNRNTCAAVSDTTCLYEVGPGKINLY